MPRTLETIIVSLTHDVEWHKNQLDDFADRLKVDPCYELSWSDSKFDLAAEYKVYGDYLKFLNGEVNSAFNGDRLATTIEELTRDVRQLAAQNPSSTSVTSNRMENALRVAKVKLLDMLEGRRF